MSIKIGYDSKSNTFYLSSMFEKELNTTPFESEAIKKIIALLPDSVDNNKLRIERRSNSYISIFYGNNDFLRLKFSEKTKWISIRLSQEDMKLNLNNPLFAAQTNKNQFHWKARVSSIDELEQFRPFLISSCTEL